MSDKVQNLLVSKIKEFKSELNNIKTIDGKIETLIQFQAYLAGATDFIEASGLSVPAALEKANSFLVFTMSALEAEEVFEKSLQ